MAEIGQQVFAYDGTRKFLRLYREEFVRPLGLSRTVAYIRVGILANIADSGGNLSGAGYSFFGLCSGANSPYTSASTVHAMGFENASWSYNAGGGNPYYGFGSSWNALKKVNGVSNRDAIGSVTAYLPTNTGSTSRKGLWLFDVAPGGNTVTSHGIYTSAVNTEITYFNLLESVCMRRNYVSFSYGGSIFWNYDKSPAGSSSAVLDTLNIFWAHGNAPIQIFGIAVYGWDI